MKTIAQQLETIQHDIVDYETEIMSREMWGGGTAFFRQNLKVLRERKAELEGQLT